MDICHLKNSELEPKHEKYRGRVVLRGDSVKDDSGSYTVFTKQGSSASQMTAAKVMDVRARLPGCAKPQMQHPLTPKSKWKMHQNCWKLQIRMSRDFVTFAKIQMSKIMVQYGRPSCSSWTKTELSPSIRTIMEKAIWESSIECGEWVPIIQVTRIMTLLHAWAWREEPHSPGRDRIQWITTKRGHARGHGQMNGKSLPPLLMCRRTACATISDSSCFPMLVCNFCV